jgi:ABC-type branched-subunit amino acid transport system ATPase component
VSQLLRLEQVDAGYGSAHILHKLSLHVDAGERVSLIGRNGVGKTTVVNAILGLATVRGGSIRIGAHTIDRPRAYVAAKHGLAVVPQGRRNIANLTVEENLLLGAAVGRRGPRTTGKIYEMGARRCQAGSSTCSRSVALMANPALILLDEP